MPSGLQNKRILVTRPAGLSTGLCSQIKARGGIAVELPLVEIEAVELDTKELVSKPPEILIFTSRNAVKYLDPAFYETINPINVFAVGPGTAEELARQGIRDVHYPAKGIGSEALLEHPKLQEQQVVDKHIAIITGVDGRDVLINELRARKAVVMEHCVYRRSQADIDKELLENLWNNTPPDVIVITSGEGLNNLVNLTPPGYLTNLYHTALVVVSKRIADMAMNQGFKNTINVSPGADDDSILGAIMAIYEETIHD